MDRWFLQTQSSFLRLRICAPLSMPVNQMQSVLRHLPLTLQLGFQNLKAAKDEPRDLTIARMSWWFAFSFYFCCMSTQLQTSDWEKGKKGLQLPTDIVLCIFSTYLKVCYYTVLGLVECALHLQKKVFSCLTFSSLWYINWSERPTSHVDRLI